MQSSGAITPNGIKGLFQPALIPFLVRLDALEEDPENVRLHPDDNLTALRGSLETFGQAKPVVTRDGRLVAGNGTLRVAKALGWTHLAAVEFSGDERFAKAYAIADNRVPELASWDQVKLDAQLVELSVEWSSAGLEWTADTVGFDAPSEPRPEREPRPEHETGPTVEITPPASSDTLAYQTPCASCGGTDTVCAPCILSELRELLSEQDENVGPLAAASWCTAEQVRNVLQAVKARHPALADPSEVV